jgi:uncharacterized membrane protein YcfT
MRLIMCAAVFSRSYLVNGEIFGKDALCIFLKLCVRFPSESFLRVGSIMQDTITVALSFPFKASDIFVGFKLKLQLSRIQQTLVLRD